MFKSLERQLHIPAHGLTMALESDITVARADRVFNPTAAVALEGLFGPSKEDVVKFNERRKSYIEMLEEIIGDLKSTKRRKEDKEYLEVYADVHAKLQVAVKDAKPDPAAFAKLELAGELTTMQDALLDIITATPAVVSFIEGFMTSKFPMTRSELYKVIDNAFKASKSLSSKAPIGAYTENDDAGAHLAGAIDDIHLGIKANVNVQKKPGATYKDAGYTADFPTKLLNIAGKAITSFKDLQALEGEHLIALFQRAITHAKALPEDKKSSKEAFSALHIFVRNGMDLAIDTNRMYHRRGLNHAFATAMRIAKTYTK